MEKTIRVGPWVKGMDNIQPDISLDSNALRTVVNADITDDGKIRRRAGLTEVEPGAVHSLWSDDNVVLYVKNSDLYQLMPNNSSILMRAGITGRTMQYESVNGDIYYANGAFMGKVVNGATREWGVEVPTTTPTVTVNTATGSMPSGRYQVVATYVNMWGEESAPSHFAVVNASGSISVSVGAAASPEVQSVRLYMTPPDGEVYYRVAEGPASSSFLALISEPVYGMALSTQFLARVIPGEILCYHGGRMWFVVDEYLYYTEPYNFGLYNPAKNYFKYPVRVDMVESTQSGLYVSADHIYWINGTDPDKMVQLAASDKTAARYSGFVEEETNRALWYGQRGVTIGDNVGNISQIQADTVAVDAPLMGAVSRVEINGVKQYLAAAVPKSDVNQLAARDFFDAEIERKA